MLTLHLLPRETQSPVKRYVVNKAFQNKLLHKAFQTLVPESRNYPPELAIVANSIRIHFWGKNLPASQTSFVFICTHRFVPVCEAVGRSLTCVQTREDDLCPQDSNAKIHDVQFHRPTTTM